MILTCPHCATRYQADAAKFPSAGRTVRCAKCSHVWHQDPPLPEPAIAPVVARAVEVFQPEPEPQPVAVPEPPRRAAYVPPAPVVESEPEIEEKAPRRTPGWAVRIGLGLGWVALVAVILVIGFATVTWREQVATIWPRTASLYAALGMKVNAVGIGFADVTHSQQTEDGQAVLAISGKLVNLSARKISVPPIEVTLTDSSRHAVLRKSFMAGVATLEPGQIATFLARLSSPPPAARHLELRFAAR
jgi:predicted Zn finger-like uncharacterized protein